MKKNDPITQEALAKAESSAIIRQVACSSLTVLTVGSIAAMSIGKIDGEPLEIAARWLMLPAATLLFGIANVGSRRMPVPTKSRDIVEGGKSAPEMQLPLSFLSNTLE